MKKLTFAIIYSAVVTASIMVQASAQAEFPTRPMSESLTADYAEFRAKQVSHVAYQLQLTFDQTSTEFHGESHISFNLRNHFNQPLTLDFEKGTIEQVLVNNKPVTWQYKQWFITLSPEHFKPGKNSINVKYHRPYSTDGSGLHRFVDPEDGEVYLYTDFEPYDANRLFPHFDQPDLKATFSSQVIAPKHWQVISTTRETNIIDKGEQRVWVFPESLPISSYVYALHAGPYHQWQDKFEDIPLRLFARQSIAKYVKPQDWFIPTKQSFAFFNRYFDYRYPFHKYDQIMAPDFNSGAMENVAAVTFNEGYVSRGEKSVARKKDLANTIAHEMAHMWFGDLVTMKWWNGLWLNESFATYMANLALDKASDFDGVWNTFYSNTKQWAYATDQSVNTHPIELPVKNTAEAFSNFDGITYGKGASVLKQIPHLLGEENFRQGVAHYLKRYAYQNTSLQDFMTELGKAADKDLSQWTEQWLYHAGTNTIEASFQCNNGQITQFTIEQSAPEEYPILREQRVQLGLYQLNQNRVQQTQKLPVLYQGKTTPVAELKGKPCPDLVYPNLDDWGFVKVNLDNKSLATLQQHINDIDDNMLRLMLWQSLWDSVYDAKIPVTQYVNFALANIKNEHDETIIRNVVRYLSSAQYYLYIAQQRGKNTATYRQQIEQFMWQMLQQAPAKSEHQKIWYSAYINNVFSPEHLTRLQQLLTEELTINGLTLDQDKRWQLVIKLSRYQFGHYQQLLAQERQRDTSDTGIKRALTAEAIQPDAKAKAQWFDIVLNNPDNLKLSTLRAIMYNLFPIEQQVLAKPYEQKALQEIPRLNDSADLGYLSAFANAFVPAYCHAESIKQLTKANETFKTFKPQVVKTFKGALQNDQRCVSIVNLIPAQ
jgi:aminopeptidase N